MIYCLDKDGKELWNYATKGEVSSLAIGDLDKDLFMEVFIVWIKMMREYHHPLLQNRLGNVSS